MTGERIRERQSRCRELRCAGGVLKTTGPACLVSSSQSFVPCFTNELVKIAEYAQKLADFLRVKVGYLGVAGRGRG